MTERERDPLEPLLEKLRGLHIPEPVSRTWLHRAVCRHCGKAIHRVRGSMGAMVWSHVEP